MRVLYLRSDAVGDAVLASVVLGPLKLAAGELFVAAPQGCVGLYEACPWVDGVIGFDRLRAVRDEGYRAEVVGRLRGVGAEVVIYGAWSRETLGDYLAGMAGGRLVGMSGDLCNMTIQQKAVNDRNYSLLVRGREGVVPELVRHRELLEGVGVKVEGELRPVVWTTAADAARAEALLGEVGVVGERTVALFAGAGHRMREYGRYGEALRGVCEEMDLRVVALGGEDAREINRRNLAALGGRGVDLTGKTSLREAAEVLRRCRLAVGGETGLAQVACAVGTRNVVLAGGGHFGRFLPWSALTTLVCVPMECYGCNWECRFERVKCVVDVGPGVIEAAVRDAIDGEVPLRARVFAQGEGGVSVEGVEVVRV